MAHSKGDDDRDPAEVANYWAIDAVQKFLQEDPAETAQIQAEIEQTDRSCSVFRSWPPRLPRSIQPITIHVSFRFLRGFQARLSRKNGSSNQIHDALRRNMVQGREDYPSRRGH